MKGMFFGRVPEPPCPTCGSARVGLDYDDDYYVIPVAAGDLPGCGWATTDPAPFAHERPCPQCGGLVRTDHHPYTVTCGVPAGAEIKGCPRCRHSGHW